MKIVKKGRKAPAERKAHPAVVDPDFPVDYGTAVTPPGYRCGTCDAAGVKLWREYNTFLDHQSLRCATCAAADQGKDVSGIGPDGTYPSEYGRTDQIGWYVPAVPTEANDTYWGYTSVPEAGVRWWKNLPTRHEIDPRYAEGFAPR